MIRGTMKAILRLLFVAACLLGATGLAFGDSYSLANSNGGDGYVVGDYPAFQLFGADNEVDDNFTTFTTTVSAAETLNLNWSYSTEDEYSSWDPAGYILNGTKFELISSDAISGNGVLSIDLKAGDTFGWYVYTPDGLAGRGEIDVTPTPEPGSMLLLGSGLAGLVSLVRRKRAA